MAVTNLFTNPRLKGNGTWAEVRRNLATNPRMERIEGGKVAGIAEPIVGAGGTVTATYTNDNPMTGSHALRYEVAGGGAAILPISDIAFPTPAPEAVTVISRIRVSAPVRVVMLGYGEVSTTDTVIIPVGEWVEMRGVASPLAYEGLALYGGFAVYPLEGEAELPAVTVDIDSALVVLGNYDGPYFDGSTTPETAAGVVQPEDFRWRWSGAENASESVMEIEQVRGLTAVNAVAGVSTRAGKPAIRLIPTDAPNLSYAWVAVPVEARTGGTALGTLYLDEPLTGPLNTDALSFRVHNPVQKESAPNTSGEYPLRLKFSDLTSGNTLRLYHGGAQGSGDVWWTDIGLFAGEYSGPYGDGSMRGWYWAGEPDNSVSIKAPRQPREQRRKMYFGVPGAMAWVPCPQIERPSGLTQWQEEVPLLNGGLHVRRSYGGHRVFEMTWNGISVEEAQLLEAYASGVYGVGLIYWLDPMMADKNVLPIWWSAPAMGALGAPSLGAGRRPPAVQPEHVQHRTATFELFPGEEGPLLPLPVPENHVLYVGARGASLDGAALDLMELRDDGGTSWRGEVPLTELGTAPLQMAQEMSLTPGGKMYGLQIRARSTGGSLSLSEVVAQVLPLGIKPEQDLPLVAGMGAAGCVITEFEKTDMSAAFNKVNVTMVLSEVGPWR